MDFASDPAGWHSKIVCEARLHAGKPHVAGSGILVEDILRALQGFQSEDVMASCYRRMVDKLPSGLGPKPFFLKLGTMPKEKVETPDVAVDAEVDGLLRENLKLTYGGIAAAVRFAWEKRYRGWEEERER